MPPSEPEPPRPPLPKSFRALEVASTIGCFALGAYLGTGVLIGWGATAPHPARALLAVIAGYLAADLASGVVHFLADTVGSSETPILGRKFILPFRTHHVSPTEIVEHDFFETNGDSCFIASLVLLVPVVLLDPARGDADLLWTLFALTLAGLVVLTTQFHKWAHSPTVPRPVGWLQRSGLILGPDHHARHHEPPFDRSYCITSGILNPLIDATGVLRRRRPAAATTAGGQDAETRAR